MCRDPVSLSFLLSLFSVSLSLISSILSRQYPPSILHGLIIRLSFLFPYSMIIHPRYPSLFSLFFSFLFLFVRQSFLDVRGRTSLGGG